MPIDPDPEPSPQAAPPAEADSSPDLPPDPDNRAMSRLASLVTWLALGTTAALGLAVTWGSRSGAVATAAGYGSLAGLLAMGYAIHRYGRLSGSGTEPIRKGSHPLD